MTDSQLLAETEQALRISDITKDITKHSGFAGHETVLHGSDPLTGLEAYIGIHSTRLGAAMGGTRIWAYENRDEAITDVLRLSHGMTLKNAVCGIPHGGGKAVIMIDPKVGKTKDMLASYAQMLTTVADRYYTAEDVGLTLADADYLSSLTSNALGTTAGGSGNPSPVTAHGVYLGIKEAVRFKTGRDTVAGMTVAMQGLGAVGMTVARKLHADGAKLTVSDLSQERVAEAASELDARAVPGDEILFVDADVLAPCALGGVLNPNTIPELKVSIVAGAANNQLLTMDDADRLRERGILYAPDFVINAAGVMNVAAELWAGGYDREKVMHEVQRIPAALAQIFQRSESDQVSTETVARQIADEVLSAT